MPDSKSHDLRPDDVEVEEVNFDDPAPEERRSASGRRLDPGTRPHVIVHAETMQQPAVAQPVESIWEKRAKSAVAVAMVFGAFWVLFQDQRTSLREQAAAAKEQATSQGVQLQSVLNARDMATAAALQKSEMAAVEAWRRRSEERAEAMKHADAFLIEQRRIAERLDTLIDLTRAQTKVKPTTPPKPPVVKDDGSVAPLPREATEGET